MQRSETQAQRDALLAVAHQLADAAATETLSRFRDASLSVDDKSTGGGFDPVTEADCAAETAMRRILAELRPQDGILGEEYTHKESESGILWVLDPIDGTRAYMAGIPLWGTLIAISDAEGPIFGIIAHPFTGERYVGSGDFAELQHTGQAPRRIRTRPCKRLADATLLSTFPEVGTAAERAAFAHLSAECRLTRYGTDCYGYALLASGQVDLVVEAGLQPYDVQAPQAVIEAAGGVFTTWDGGSASEGGRILAAGDPVIHRLAMDALNQA
ncbi:MAG: histidinol-phosphatase [Pseudomonadota bacterium]